MISLSAAVRANGMISHKIMYIITIGAYKIVSGDSHLVILKKDGTTEVYGSKKPNGGKDMSVISMKQLLEDYDLDFSQVAYMGDDLPDIPVIKEVGLGCCPNDAVDEVREVATFISSKNGGRGAVREMCDLIYKNLPNH